MILYKFRFYREHADLVLAFHHAKISTTLLDVITDCEIDAYGDMPANSIAKYELYYFAGAFYNMQVTAFNTNGRIPFPIFSHYLFKVFRILLIQIYPNYF